MHSNSEQQQTVIDGLSVLRLGLINVIDEIRDLDPAEAANAGALNVLGAVLEPTLRDLIASGLDWVGDVSLAMNLNLTSGGVTDTPVIRNASPAMKRQMINTCFAARAELRRVETLLDKRSSGINTALVRVKGATETTRAAFRSVLSRIESIENESRRNTVVRVTKEMSSRAVQNARVDGPPRVATGSRTYSRAEIPPLAASPAMRPAAREPIAEGMMVPATERQTVSHQYSMSQRSRVERVVSHDVPPSKAVLFAEVGPGRSPWKRPRPAATFRKRTASRLARGTQPKAS